MADTNALVDQLSGLTVLEIADLVKQLEEKWGVSAAAPVAVAAAGPAAAAAPVEEKTSFDVILTEADIDEKKAFPDGCVLTTWSIDLHIPHPVYTKANPERPFISKDIHRQAVDSKVGYPIPYRCFYCRNVPNLFMAGRNISVTREALGTIRVMKTIGMMGAAVGRAAAICKLHDCKPRDVYEDHLEEVKILWRTPGKQRFDSLDELRKATEAAAKAR
jgi:hypothetical protein